jgi:hypothetical protein
VEVISDSISETFYTRPLPPTGFHLVAVGKGWRIAWIPSLTPYVTHYKIRWGRGLGAILNFTPRTQNSHLGYNFAPGVKVCP